MAKRLRPKDSVRNAIVATFGNRCATCSLPLVDLDRIDPGEDGGNYDFPNIIPHCRRCHDIRHVVADLYTPEVLRASREDAAERYSTEWRYEEARASGERKTAVSLFVNTLSEDWIRLGAYRRIFDECNDWLKNGDDNDLKTKASLIATRGIALRWQGMHAEAIRTLTLTPKLSECLEPDLRRRALRAKADSLCDLDGGQDALALDLYNEVESLARDANDLNELFRTRSGAIMTLARLGRSSQARDLSTSTLAFAEATHHTRGIIQHLERWSALRIWNREFNVVWENLRRMMRLEAARNDVRALAYGWRRMAEIHSQIGHPHEALVCLSMYETWARDFQDPNGRLANKIMHDLRSSLGNRFQTVKHEASKNLRTYADSVFLYGCLP